MPGGRGSAESDGDVCGFGMDEILDYVYDHFEDFQLLLDASYGTRYQDFVEHLVDIETEYTYKYIEATASLQDGSEITEEFIHIMARAMFDSMFEVVRHRMDRDTARKYLHMLRNIIMVVGCHHKAGVRGRLRLRNTRKI